MDDEDEKEEEDNEKNDEDDGKDDKDDSKEDDKDKNEDEEEFLLFLGEEERMDLEKELDTKVERFYIILQQFCGSRSASFWEAGYASHSKFSNWKLKMEP
jgi:hypothetical protein